MTLEFTVFGVSQPQGSTRAFMPKGAKFPVITSTNRDLKAWRTQMALEASAALAKQGGRQIVGAVRVRARFVLPRPQSLPKSVVHHTKAPDLDKLQRAVGDSLAGVVIEDDKKIVQWKTEKVYAAAGEAPHAIIAVDSLA